MNIAVFGWYHHRNAGDDRIQYCMTRWLDGHTLAFLPAGRPPSTAMLRNYDAAIIGGGGLISTRGGVFRNMSRWVNAAGIPVALAGVSIERMPEDLRSELREFLDVCAFAWFRDQGSLDELGPHRNAFVAPDLTWLHPLPLLSPAPAGAIALCLRTEGGLDIPAWRRTLDHIRRPIVAWPLYFERGGDAHGLKGVLPGSSIPDEFSIDQLAATSVIVSARYHGLIFGLQAGRPVVAISDHPKVTRFMSESGLSAWRLSPSGFEDLPAVLRRIEDGEASNLQRILELRDRLVQSASTAAERSRERLLDAAEAAKRSRPQWARKVRSLLNSGPQVRTSAPDEPRITLGEFLTLATLDVSETDTKAGRFLRTPMSCLMVVPDGMGLRNFLYSRFLDYFGSEDGVVVWHDLPNAVVPARDDSKAPIVFRALPGHREGLTERILRQAKTYGQLYWRHDSGTDFILGNLQKKGRLLDRAIGTGARALGRLGGQSGPMLARLDRWHAAVSGRRRRVQEFEAVIKSIQPDVVFCTHQRASRAVPAMLAARRLGIPTATFIYSWDNLPKGRMAVHADHFLVWSDHMKAELRHYYPEVDGTHVHVVGTPQFEAYFDQSITEARQSFLQRLGLDPRRRVVCFSGCDLTTSPHDPVYLDDLATALIAVPLSDRPQIVFRRCPVDRSDRYQWVLDRHPEIAVSEPLWRSDATSDWTGATPSVDDSALLANLVRHSDVVVNLGSTMAMDFAILGKPGVFLAYEPVPPPPDAKWTAGGIYTLPHMQSVYELEPVYWVRSRDEMASIVMHALEHPDEKKAARERWVERLAQHPLDQASRRCYEALHTMSRK